MWQLLMAIRECGLKNDALMDSFYDLVMENYKSRRPYAVYISTTDMIFRQRQADEGAAGGNQKLFLNI